MDYTLINTLVSCIVTAFLQLLWELGTWLHTGPALCWPLGLQFLP